MSSISAFDAVQRLQKTMDYCNKDIDSRLFEDVSSHKKENVKDEMQGILKYANLQIREISKQAGDQNGKIFEIFDQAQQGILNASLNFSRMNRDYDRTAEDIFARTYANVTRRDALVIRCGDAPFHVKDQSCYEKNASLLEGPVGEFEPPSFLRKVVYELGEMA